MVKIPTPEELETTTYEGGKLFGRISNQFVGITASQFVHALLDLQHRFEDDMKAAMDSKEDMNTILNLGLDLLAAERLANDLNYLNT